MGLLTICPPRQPCLRLTDLGPAKEAAGRLSDSGDGWPATREHAFGKSEAQLSRGRIPVQGGHEDALCRGSEKAEDEPVDRGDRHPNDETNDSADQGADHEERDAGKGQQDEDRGEGEVSTRRLAPGLPEKRAAPLHSGPRTDLLEDQDRDDEIRHDAPGGPREPGDDPPDESEPLCERPQDQSDRRAHEGPARDPFPVLPRNAQAVRDRRVSTVQAEHGGAHHRRGEVNRDEEGKGIDELRADVERATHREVATSTHRRNAAAGGSSAWLDGPRPVLDHGLAANLDGRVREWRAESVAAVVRAPAIPVVSNPDAHGSRDDRILKESG